jgi:hypothetical protein
MARDIPVGNGALLVTFDADYWIHAIYFPYVGQENHTAGHPYRPQYGCIRTASWAFPTALPPLVG